MSNKFCLYCRRSLLEGANHYGLHFECFREWFNEPELLLFTNLTRRAASKEPLSREDENRSDFSSFFHGQYKKYSAQLGNHSYILKFGADPVPELPDVEYLSNRIAKSLGLRIADYYLIEYAPGERVFVTKNFVDKKRNQNLNHIYQYRPQEKRRDCETLIDIIWEETKQFSDVETFVQACLFDALIGNHDRHGRNLGFLSSPGNVRLAPIYDNPSALGIEKGSLLDADFNPSCRIPTRSEENPSPADYVTEFARLGHRSVVESWIKRLNEKEIVEIIHSGFCSERMKNALVRLVTKRIDQYRKAMARLKNPEAH